MLLLWYCLLSITSSKLSYTGGPCLATALSNDICSYNNMTKSLCGQRLHLWTLQVSKTKESWNKIVSVVSLSVRFVNDWGAGPILVAKWGLSLCSWRIRFATSLAQCYSLPKEQETLFMQRQADLAATSYLTLAKRYHIRWELVKLVHLVHNFVSHTPTPLSITPQIHLISGN